MREFVLDRVVNSADDPEICSFEKFVMSTTIAGSQCSLAWRTLKLIRLIRFDLQHQYFVRNVGSFWQDFE